MADHIFWVVGLVTCAITAFGFLALAATWTLNRWLRFRKTVKITMNAYGEGFKAGKKRGHEEAEELGRVK